MLPGQVGQPYDGAAMDAGKSPGLADAVALGQVFEDGEGLLRGELGADERGALVLEEAGLAGITVEETKILKLSESAVDRQIADVAIAVDPEVARGHDAFWAVGRW